MESVLVVSPDYLHAIYSEMGKYSFHLQGYGCFKRACQGLQRVNCGELIGAAYLSARLPEYGGIEFGYLLQFLKLYDSLGETKQMMFVCGSSLSPIAKEIKQLKHVKVKSVALDGFVTDTVINKDMFGNLLLGVSEPYKLKEQVGKQAEESNDGNYLLKYVPSIEQSILQCLDPVVKMATVQLTLENDKVYQQYSADGNSLLMVLRRRKISEAFGGEDKQAARLFDTMLQKVKDDSLWCIYKCMYGMGVKAIDV